MKKAFLWFCSLLVILTPNPILEAKPQSERALKQAVEKLGQLPFKDNIPIRYLSRQKLEAYITKVFAEEYPDQVKDKEALYLYLMGFIDKKGMDVKEERKKILSANVGGLYDEQTRQLYALDSYRDINYMNSMVLIHELRHGIQDQHFRLAGLLESRPDSDFDDRKLALLAAIEGDATFLMVLLSDFDVQLLASGFGGDSLLSFSPSMNSARIAEAPGVIKHQFTMPYLEGAKFVDYIFRKKKWKGVNRILASPPASSEQVLHPVKYLKKEMPIQVTIGYKPGDYTLYHSGVIGEYYLNILLEPGDKPVDFARDWGGDRFEIYKNDTSHVLLWKSEWDKEDACSRFFHDYRRFLERRFNLNFRKGNRKGRDFLAGKSPDGLDYFFISRLQKRLFYVRTNDRNLVNTFISGGHYD